MAQTTLDEILDALADVESVLDAFGCTHAVSRAAAADVLGQVDHITG